MSKNFVFNYEVIRDLCGSYSRFYTKDTRMPNIGELPSIIERFIPDNDRRWLICSKAVNGVSESPDDFEFLTKWASGEIPTSEETYINACSVCKKFLRYIELLVPEIDYADLVIYWILASV